MMIAAPLAQTRAILNPAPTERPAAVGQPSVEARTGVSWTQDFAEPEFLIRKLVLEPAIVRSEIAVIRTADKMYDSLLSALD